MLTTSRSNSQPLFSVVVFLLLWTTLSAIFGAAPIEAQTPPCRPCAGIITTQPEAAAEAIAPMTLGTEDRLPLYIAWDHPLSAAPESGVERSIAISKTLRTAQVTPWVRVIFDTPAPLLENEASLKAQLEDAARIARGSAPDTHFQIIWTPAQTEAGFDPVEAGYLIKRAAVAITGARTNARVISLPLPGDVPAIEALYGEDIAAYIDGIALSPDADPATLSAELARLDPGRPVIADGLDQPTPTSRALAEAAELASQGVSIALFEISETNSETLAPFVVLAREFAGDLSFDPYSTPTGAKAAWSFVRGEDLALRVIVDTGTPVESGDELLLSFPDPQLRGPETVGMAPDTLGTPETVFGSSRRADALEVPLSGPGPIVLLRVERGSAADLGGIEESVEVAGERQMPVEEILRRLQAFEDDQIRRLDHFQAVNTTHMRFGAGAGVRSLEATLEGDFFFRQDRGYDWAWQRFFVNGVRWKGKSIPEIPLVQPEKAAALPLEINFTRRYTYRLVGTDVVDGRDCWVVEFRPTEGYEPESAEDEVESEAGEADEESESLYRGRVWVDREHFARVRTRTVQLGLQGEVISNEETLFNTPVDASGEPVAWDDSLGEHFVMPLRLVGQQLLTVLNSNVLIEREVLLTELRINGDEFDDNRRSVLASDSTMVRDTEKGLRYLVKEDDSGDRVVQEEFDTNRLFGLGGVFYDDSLDFPLPLAGLNYLDFDFRGTGTQVNAFFGGALLTVDAGTPRLFGSKWDFGGDAFAIAVPFTDTLFRDDKEVREESVESRPANLSILLGRPIGNFFKLGLEYELSHLKFERAKDAAPEFVTPTSHFFHTFALSGSYTRSGYRLQLGGSYNKRQEWEPWGLPGNEDFSEDKADYLLWNASLAKSWYLPRFQKVGVDLAHVGGEDLDRFSKYGFGFFGDTRVHGYQSNRVRATEANVGHLSYGFEIGSVFRVEATGDVAWATDKSTGLDNEMLAGLGIGGTFMGPWETIINLDIGVPVAGPDDGFVAYLVFLKIFDRGLFGRK